MSPPERVLVLGDDTRGFLACVRALGRHGIEVHAAPANFRSPSLRSRYISAVHRLPPWMDDGAAWLDAAESLLTGIRFDAVLPCVETTLLPLQAGRARLGAHARLAIPDDEAIRVFFDKKETRDLAARLGIAVAPGRLARGTDTPAQIIAEFGGAVVVKPRWSYRLGKLHQRGKVCVATGAHALTACLAGAAPDDIVLEALFPGEGIGVSILSHKGLIRQIFQHRRVRERGGTSFYRVSEAVDPALERACAAMAAALGYSGIAMFEFRRNAGGNTILLEVNARPWGSLPLAESLGLDFIHRYYRQLVHGEVSSPSQYRTPIYGRNLVPDLRAAFTEAVQAKRPVQAINHLGREAWGLRRILTGAEVQDVFARDDMAPAAAEIGALARASLHRAGRYLPGLSGQARHRACAMTRAAWQGGGTLLFLCQGNICRSPFAAASLQALLSGSSRVASAGILPLPGRASPDFAVDEAKRYGIDLSTHRSRFVTEAGLSRAGVIFLFDDVNRTTLLDLFPACAPKLVQLGDFARSGGIADPIGGDAAMFHAIYASIFACIREIARIVMPSYTS